MAKFVIFVFLFSQFAFSQEIEWKYKAASGALKSGFKELVKAEKDSLGYSVLKNEEISLNAEEWKCIIFPFDKDYTDSFKKESRQILCTHSSLAQVISVASCIYHKPDSMILKGAKEKDIQVHLSSTFIKNPVNLQMRNSKKSLYINVECSLKE